jgi:site-specific DNA-methyltransferase (adenine-specific)
MPEDLIDKIFHEDCLVGMTKIPDKSVDCIICDLPYGKLKGVGTLTDWDVPIPFEPLWEQYNRIAKENAAVLLFGVEPFTSYIVMSNIKNYRQKLTWLKS